LNKEADTTILYSPLDYIYYEKKSHKGNEDRPFCMSCL